MSRRHQIARQQEERFRRRFYLRLLSLRFNAFSIALCNFQDSLLIDDCSLESYDGAEFIESENGQKKAPVENGLDRGFKR